MSAVTRRADLHAELTRATRNLPVAFQSWNHQQAVEFNQALKGFHSARKVETQEDHLRTIKRLMVTPQAH